VSSQRDREHRIAERLQTGTLALAGPSTVVQPSANGTGTCHGCAETGTDALAGEHPWHSLCALFWQGRSATLREQRIPHTQPGPGVAPARSRWVIVVPVDRPDAYESLRRSFARSAWVDVVMDRRRGQSGAAAGAGAPVDRRTVGHRSTLPDPTREPPFRLAHRGDGCEVYESTGPEAGRCPECAALVSVELPRFVEPPVRLELIVRHEPIPADRSRHVVELQSFSPTGRVLLATRLAGRVRSTS
jgi:hypothetical protein